MSRLARGCEQLGMEASRLAPCSDYLALLWECNRSHGLLADREPLRLVERHILDSLTLLPYLRGPLCLDIGSGAGLPGLVLALAQPQQDWIVLDRARRKVQFLHQARVRLALDNVTVLQGRVQDYIPDPSLSTIVCRALAPLPRLLALSGHLLGPGRRLLAMKGRRVSEELAACPARPFRFRCHPLSGPGSNSSTLVEISLA